MCNLHEQFILLDNLGHVNHIHKTYLKSNNLKRNNVHFLRQRNQLGCMSLLPPRRLHQLITKSWSEPPTQSVTFFPQQTDMNNELSTYYL